MTAPKPGRADSFSGEARERIIVHTETDVMIQKCLMTLTGMRPLALKLETRRSSSSVMVTGTNSAAGYESHSS